MKKCGAEFIGTFAYIRLNRARDGLHGRGYFWRAPKSCSELGFLQRAISTKRSNSIHPESVCGSVRSQRHSTSCVSTLGFLRNVALTRVAASVQLVLV